jgi:Class III cytochrome C family
MALLVVPPLLVAGASAALLQSDDTPFPHDEHEGLFPLCIGCHTGVPDGASETFYPEVDSCANCHDGEQAELVEWERPDPRPSTLSFAHPSHQEEVIGEGEASLGCADCHVTPDQGRMTVDGNPPERCLSCHSDPEPAPVHVVGADCAMCHVPLAESELTADRMADLLVPDGHSGDEFVLETHGAEAIDDVSRCATCHVQEQCTSCHVATGLEPIPSVPEAPRTLPFTALKAHYPTPESHVDDQFLFDHDVGAGAESCATCHTKDDCVACHVGAPSSVLEELPEAGNVVAPGVHVDRREPGSHESPFFMEAHAPLASAGAGGCATCHTQDSCAACHDGATSNSFHDNDFVSQHAADAFSQNSECSNCHNTQVFCRACHVQVGFESRGRLNAGYHDAEPIWLLRHGQAARQTLETCASCHAQSECTQCHSTVGAFKVSPHPADFDAEKARSKNARTCLACHVTIPGGRDQ